MFRSKCLEVHRGFRGTIVSILVLVDVSLEVQDLLLNRLAVLSFNPCSRGCFARRAGGSSLERIRINVSILVLVDVSLED